MSLSVAVISGPVGKTPEDITYSFVFDEAYRLAKKGLEVHVVRSKVEGDSLSCGIHFHGIRRRADPQAVGLTLRNLPLYPPISVLRKPTSIYWENLYAESVSRVVEKNNIDLIHAHFAYPEGLVGLLARKRTGKPLIVTIHGYDILIEPAVNFGIRQSMKYDALVRKVIKGSDALIVNSRAVYKEVLKTEPCAKSKLHLIPLGVDGNRFNPKVNGLSVRQRLGIENKSVVFTLKAHEPRYRIEDIIRAAAIVTSRHDQVVFLIGGAGSLKNYHQNLSKKLNISSSIIFLDKITYDELPLYYAACDVFVNSALGEGFGIVTAEAMATGKPAVAVKRHGSIDLVSDGINGFLVEPMSPQGIADKIMYFVENLKEAKRMGMNGRKMVEEKFDIKKRIDRIISLYKRLQAGRLNLIAP
jgi:glycosyltransferase involved in cell wall biosynthesis